MLDLARERCQFENTIYRYMPPFATLRRLRRAGWRLSDAFKPRAGLGTPSRFAVGAYVRVKDEAAIRATLDENDALRGLTFTRAQWDSCGKTFRVQTVVRRMMNDKGLMRAIGRTVALDDVTCGGPRDDDGCGRACPLLFRDEWLEPSSEERAEPRVYERYARVKPLAAILETLDARGVRAGVAFAPVMARFAGARLPISKQVEPVAATGWRRSGAEWYVLAGARCGGESLASDGPCHRGCGLLWHRDWLTFES